MSGANRFKLRSKAATDQDKYNDSKTKLESVINNQERRANEISKRLMVDKLLNDKEVNSNDLRDMMKMGQNINIKYDKETEKAAVRNLKSTTIVTGTELTEVTNTLKKVSDENCVHEWSVKIAPAKETFPDVMINLNMVTAEPVLHGGGDMPTISKMTAEVEGVEGAGHAELEAAVRQSCELREPQQLVRRVASYLPLAAARQQLMDSADPDHCAHNGDNNILHFIDGAGDPLAQLHLQLSCSRSPSSWEPSWRCRLSEKGKEACARLNVTEELLQTGRVEGWDWAMAVDNLTKVVRFSSDQGEESPEKEKEFDASNVDTATPILRGRLPKRKLN